MSNQRELASSIRQLQEMVKHDIERCGEMESFMVRVGLLRDILKLAAERLSEVQS